MQLLKIEIPKSKLSAIPKNERVFFVQSGNLLNDVNILQKLIYFSANPETNDKIVRTAQNLQALSLLRIQAGKLSEGWQLVEKNFFGAKVSQEYEPLLTEPEKNSLTHLKNYFAKKNLISSIRNDFAFHYPSSEEITKLIDEAPDSEIFEVYLSEFYGNCLFSLANVLVTFGILKSIGTSGDEEPMKTLLQDINKVTRWFGDFLGGCLLVFSKKHSGLNAYNVEIPQPPDINDVTLPYFIKGKRR